eukprot:TRINITY_DN74090_c0_g1_i1.p2 TRINITY_DN74090_c0_g1~~TRINITY_DN74090_c0_g1_i1.p2  ORF type:complete len:197 (-),score=72.36 TRINITY_DN74090_c0_g1_i1:156-746(-)
MTQADACVSPDFEREQLRKDIQELEAMNGALLERVADLQDELRQARADAAEAKAKLSAREGGSSSSDGAAAAAAAAKASAAAAAARQDLIDAHRELERMESLLRAEATRATDLEAELTEVRGSVCLRSREVSELELMNTMLADENTRLAEKLSRLQPKEAPDVGISDVAAEPPEPLEEPEQTDTELLELSSRAKLV